MTAGSGVRVFFLIVTALSSTCISVPPTRRPSRVWIFTFDPSGMPSATFRHCRTLLSVKAQCSECENDESDCHETHSETPDQKSIPNPATRLIVAAGFE